MSPPLVGLDTETGLIGRGRKAPPLVCYSVAYPGQQGKLYRWDDKAELFRLWHGAADGHLELLFQNAPFDAAVCAAQYPELLPVIFHAYQRGAIHDVMIRELLRDIESGGYPVRKSLDKLAKFYLGYTLEGKGDDSWRLRYWDLRELPIADWPKEAVDYACTDASILHAIYAGQDVFKLHDDTFADAPKQCAKHFALHLMATWGMRTNVEDTQALIKQLENEQTNRKQFLINAGIMRAKKESIDTKTLIKYIQEDIGVALPKTATGKPSLQKDLLQTFNDPIIETYLAFKEDDKAMSTYLEKYLDGLIQCTVNPILANGRSSLSSPSLQNLPRTGPIRECIVPREGTYLCSVDYDGIELRTFAQAQLWLLGRSKMAEAFQRDPDADLHTQLAATILRIPEAEAYRLKSIDDPDFIRKGRNPAKATNFGFGGGMGAERFVKTQLKDGNVFTVEQAKDYQAVYKKHWDLWGYFDMISRATDGGKTSMKCLVSGRYRGEVDYCTLANGYFSSLMADGSGAAFFEIQRQAYTVPTSDLFWGARR